MNIIHLKPAHLFTFLLAIAFFQTAQARSPTNGPLGSPVVPSEPPKGRIESFTFDKSTIFPGTTRKVTVFIPAQYDGSAPACTYVQQDGYRAAQKNVLEQLIAAKDMPVTVGVFIEPGQTWAPSKDEGVRRNRSLEYDGLGDAYVHFLLEEVLPEVTNRYGLNLSTNGNDRCIAGASSGGISAFNAAWERPEAFSRVYANSGSFVALRGGDAFPVLVRKSEARPIRVYLTTATNDLDNTYGSWFLFDQEMERSLKFAGYEYTFRVLNGRHTAGWDSCFPEAMRFLWKDWPQPVQAGLGGPRVQDILVSGEKWELVGDRFHQARSPTCDSNGVVYFADPSADKIFQIGTDGGVSLFAGNTGHAKGLSCGAHGELYSVSSASGKIVRYDAPGKGRIVARDLPGQSILAVADGSLFVSGADVTPEGSGRVWLIKDGHKRIVLSGLKCAAGLALRPDQWLLSVADGASKWIYSSEINPDDTLTDSERYFWLHVPDGEDDAGTESLCYAREGQLFAATRLGIQVCADDGPTQVILPMPDHSRALGVCLGGPGFDTLYACCGDKVWKRKVKVHATGAFSARVKVKGSPS